MKKIIIASCLLLSGYCLFAQQQNIETEIRKLEQTEVDAVVNKDTVALKKLWDKDYIVNNPDNKIILAKSNSVDRPVLQRQKVSFTRVVENILINGDIAISMGKENVVATDEATKVVQNIKRRYTNIWMKKDGTWKLAARHANRLCE
jgi:ketosteroid isomerase-like protein